MTLLRAGQYRIDEVLPYILPDRYHRKGGDNFFRIYDGKKVRMTSPRYHCFAASLKCCACGLEGLFFALERNLTSVLWHFNLYGYNSLGEEILLTKDHIRPRSRGGVDHQSNYRTMCLPCNQVKGNTLPGLDR